MVCRRIKYTLVVWALIHGLLLCSAVKAENYALLIGVSDYPALRPLNLTLKGPANDVSLMYDVLIQKGFKPHNIITLADGITDTPKPTRNNILRAFGQLTNKLNPDDVVYLHFSGHGSQQPASTIEEADGMDEIFLPYDIGQWNGAKGHVENAITDNEMHILLSAIRKTGAFVWAVFDSCHSGTMTRSGGGLVNRNVPVSALGWDGKTPHLESLPTTASATQDLPLAPYVAFYAAQPSETTAELNQPRFTADGVPKKVHGMFTFQLARALLNTNAGTYRQLAQKILHAYRAQNTVQSTPLFEGTLDKPMLSNGAEQITSEWQIQRCRGTYFINAGALNNISEGDHFSIIEKTDDGEINQFSAEAVGVGISTSQLQVTDGSKLNNRWYARLEQSSPSFVTRIALPDELNPGSDPKEQIRLAQIAVQLGQDTSKHVSWVSNNQDAEFRLFTSPDSECQGRLWIMPVDSLFECDERRHFSIPLHIENIAEQLKIKALRIAKAQNLLKLVSHYDSSATDLNVQLRVTHTEPGGAVQQLKPGNTIHTKDGDRISIELHNNGSIAVDATLFFVGSNHEIIVDFPNATQPINRLQPGDVAKISGFEISEKTIGIDTMVLVAVAAKPQSEIKNYAFYAQSNFIVNRNTPYTDIETLFQQAGFGHSARSTSTMDKGSVSIQSISWHVLPSRTEEQ